MQRELGLTTTTHTCGYFKVEACTLLLVVIECELIAATGLGNAEFMPFVQTHSQGYSWTSMHCSSWSQGRLSLPHINELISLLVCKKHTPRSHADICFSVRNGKHTRLKTYPLFSRLAFSASRPSKYKLALPALCALKLCTLKP